MPRYEHWLAAARPSPWPGAVLCLGVDVGWEGKGDDGNREYAALRSWSVVCMVRTASHYAVARRASGTTAESWWECMRDATHHTRNLWILGSNFRSAAVALGLWQRMENGSVTIAGKDHRAGMGKSRLRSVQEIGGGRDKPDTADLGTDTGTRQLSSAQPQGEGSDDTPRNTRKRISAGVCIVEDPPIVLEIEVDGGGGKITWVDVANYGVELDAADACAGIVASRLAEWFRGAASTLHSLGRVGWCHTAGSQAMHLFRAVYLETPILCHTEPRATALERDGLFGGRCECYRIGRLPGTWNLFDFRSMYPYLYANTRVPVRLVRTAGAVPVSSVSQLPENYWTIARVDIETDEPEYPYHAEHATVYPTGRFTTTLCGPELHRAVQSGACRRISRAAVYESEYVLRRYAKEIYSIRQTADGANDGMLSAWAKRLMNCLHGKFAQRSRYWQDMPGAESRFEWGEWYTVSKSGEPQRWRSLAWYVQREVTGGFGHGTVPAISAAVCAAGRERLYQAIRTAGRANVSYCDTDALLCNSDGAERLRAAGLVRPGEWGFLQPVASGDDAEVFGDKWYQIGGRSRCSGGVFMGRDRDGNGGYIQSQPGIRERLRTQQAPADWREQHAFSRGPGRYDRVREPGGFVKPIELMEW